MAYEREQAIGKLVVKRKQIFELGVKGQNLADDLSEQFNFMANPENDFLSVDCKKSKVLLNELMKIQEEFKKISSEAESLKTTFNIEE